MAQTTSIEQRYLLQRLPNEYHLRQKPLPEPSAVRKARRLVRAWDEREEKRGREFSKQVKKMINEAREAIYFKPAAEALKVIKKLEALQTEKK